MPSELPTGKLAVKSEPSAASIYVDCKDIAEETPKTISLPTGSHLITLKKDKFADYAFCVEIAKNETIEKDLIKLLKPTDEPIPTGQFSIESAPSHSVILVDLEDTRKLTPEKLTLPKGCHLITLKQDLGYDDESFCVEIIKEELLEKFIELPKSTGKLTITSKPSNANIWLAEFESKESVNTGLLTPQTLTLPPSPAEEPTTITLKREGYRDQSFEIEIEKGKEIEKFVELLKIEEVAPLPPEKTGLKITSKPSSASIFLGEEDTGRITPDLLTLNPKKYEITLKKSGYEYQTVPITIQEGEILEKFIELTKSDEVVGKLHVMSKPSYAVLSVKEVLNGYRGVEETPSALTPETVTLAPGFYEVKLNREGYSEVSLFVEIVANEEFEKFVELPKLIDGDEPPTNAGKLRIESKPEQAEIWVGETNMKLLTPETLTLATGTKRIKLKKSGFDDYPFTVMIIKGGKIEKLCKLTKSTGDLFLESIPSRAKIWIDGEDTHLLTPEKLILSPGKKAIKLTFPGFIDAKFTAEIIKGKKIEKFHRFTMPSDAIATQDSFFDDDIHIKDCCMQCDQPPEYDLLFSEGNIRSWLCAKHCKEFVKESSEKINAIRRIDNGKATNKFRENQNPNVVTEFIREAQIIPRKASAYPSASSLDVTKLPKAMILVSPHAELVAIGKKTLIVKSRDYSGECEKTLVFCAGSLCFGTLKMKLPRKVPKHQLDELYPLHRITPEEIEDWWPGKTEFYLYDIYDVSSWDIPRHADIPLGPQTFVKKYKLLDAEELAPVYPSGVELGEKITRNEVLQYFKSFYRTRPYISLIGGICNRGSTTGDIDIFIRSAHRDLATEFRIIRMFPEKYWFRFQFHYPYEEESHPGVFTNHMDIYDEKIEAIHSPELVLMSVPKKVELFKFAPLLKPAHGRYKGEEYSIDALMEVVNAKPEWYEKGIYCQKKFDGVHVRCDVKRHYESGYDVIIFTEEGNDITKNLPTLRKELEEASKGHAISIVGELEFWEDEKHQSRQQTTAIIHTKEVHPDESKILLNTFDTLFYDKDIHNEPHSERLKSHAKLKDTKHVKKADYTLVHSPTELCKAVEHYAGLPGSEGAYLKRADFKYELDGKTLLNLKYKSTFSIEVEVVEVHEVKASS